MKWFKGSPSWLPQWIPVVEVARHLPTVRAEVKRQGYRRIGRCFHRDAEVFVAGRWYAYARVELFILALVSNVMSFLCSQRILVGPYDGCFLHELRLNDPARWSWV